MSILNRFKLPANVLCKNPAGTYSFGGTMVNAAIAVFEKWSLS
jgi:hypothetical protein